MPQTPYRTSAQVTVSLSVGTPERGVSSTTHTSIALEVLATVHPHYLDCDLPAAVFALPHISEPTEGRRGVRWIVR